MSDRYLHVCQGQGRFKRTLMEPIQHPRQLASLAWVLDYRMKRVAGFLDKDRYWFVASRVFGKWWESPV